MLLREHQRSKQAAGGAGCGAGAAWGGGGWQGDPRRARWGPPGRAAPQLSLSCRPHPSVEEMPVPERPSLAPLSHPSPGSARPGREGAGGSPDRAPSVRRPEVPRGRDSRPGPVPSLRGCGEVIGADSGCGPPARPRAGSRARGGGGGGRGGALSAAAPPPAPGGRPAGRLGSALARERGARAPPAPTYRPPPDPHPPSRCDRRSNMAARGAPEAPPTSGSGPSPRTGATPTVTARVRPRPPTLPRSRCPWQRRSGSR